MINRDFINSVLARFEGRAIPRGYIPCTKGTFFGGGNLGRPLGVSGVTVATGVDLGQQTAEGLRCMGVSAETVAVLTPYIGLQKDAAMEKLGHAPLTLTPEQVAEIDAAVHDAYINNAALLFGRDAFTAAPARVQAVAVSLHYQFGRPERKESPALAGAWKAMQGGAYIEAAAILENPDLWSVAHRQYMARRKAEAKLLLEASNAV